MLGIEAMSAAKMLGATALVAPMVMLAMAVLTAMTVASANSAAIEDHRFLAELTASAARGMESELHRRERIIIIHPQAPRLSKAPPHISA